MVFLLPPGHRKNPFYLSKNINKDSVKKENDGLFNIDYFFVVGASAGIMEHIAMYPLDTIKVGKTI